MKSFLAGLRTLVLPWGAGPGTPRIVIGPDIPAELVTWGAAHGVTFTAVEIAYFDATHYEFRGLGSFSGEETYFTGTYDPINTVFIVNRIVLPGGAGVGSVAQRTGAVTLNTFQLRWSIQQTIIDINSQSLLEVGGDFTIDNVSAPRGERLYQRLSAKNSTGTEVLVNTTGNIDFQAGRAYELKGFVQYSSAIDQTGFLQVHHGNSLAGAVLQVAGRFRTPTGSLTMRQTFGQTFICTSSTSEVLTLGWTGGTGANPFALGDGEFRIIDRGDSANFSGAPSF